MALGIVFLAGSLFYFYEGGLPDLGAFLSLSAFAAGLLVFADLISAKKPAWIRWITTFGLGFFFSVCAVGTLQVIERFSDEEFFAGVQALLLSVWWISLQVTWRWIFRPREWDHLQLRRPVQIAMLGCVLLASIVGAVILLNAYQSSFYPQQAALFPGISTEKPFLCGDISKPEAPEDYDSHIVFQGIIDRAALNPVKNTPQLGMLALTTQEPAWMEAFRQSLLKEARQGIYTGPAGSVKYGQYETAARAYYFYKISQENPGLFTEKEEQQVLDWFSAVNRRSLTVEWVDWMYAAAYGEWPKGPYLNQENGAGLLSLLEAYQLANPELQQQNQAFLKNHSFGWGTHFRNTDDSISYQSLWINNAVFQSAFAGEVPLERIRKSFEWLLLQAPPDGSLFGYNPGKLSLAAPAYLGAQMTGDGRFVWLAGRSLDYLQSRSLDLYFQPGLEKAIQLASKQPEMGSCLLYGDSGTPVRLGPLAADKIVFRDGWKAADRYLNLNLRFTGWHRYKATNSIISIYQEDPLIIEQTNAPHVGWLPVGRSQFRDKRIPRENLNGLVIPREGISKIIFWLSGFGSAWAQNPPFYASVEKFSTGADMDQSVTSLEWNGWKQTRSIYFIHDGPTVVIDAARGPRGQAGGVTWHGLVPAETGTVGEPAGSPGQSSFFLGSKGQVEMRLVPFDEGQVTSIAEPAGDQAGIKVLYTGNNGTVKLVTLFLSAEWREVKVKSTEGFLLLQLPTRTLKIPLPLDF